MLCYAILYDDVLYCIALYTILVYGTRLLVYYTMLRVVRLYYIIWCYMTIVYGTTLVLTCDVLHYEIYYSSIGY